MKVLITGASGLLGTKLAQLAIESGHVVYSVYHSHHCVFGTPLEVDITEQDAVRKALAAIRPDVVFHTASITDVDLCETNPQIAMKVNGEATGFISAACSKVESYLIYVSTDYVFDGERGHYSEKDSPAPINTYGKSKLLGEEQMTRNSSRGCIARTSVLYGWGRLHRPNFATWLRDRLEANEPVRVVTDQFASPTLNTHLARMLLEVGERQSQGILHLAGSTRISRYEFAIGLAKQFSFNQKLIIPVNAGTISWKARRPFDSSLDVSLANETLTNKPIALHEALREFKDSQRSK